MEGNVCPPRIEIFLKHECYRFLSILVMGDLPTSLPTYISSLSKTVKRKPLIFNFKWNFGWILGQHDILVLGDVPSPKSEIFFLLKLDLSWLIPPPPPKQGLKKKIFKKIKCPLLDYVQLRMISQVIPATKVDPNVEKGPLSHQKMKCSSWITFNS